MFFCFLFRKKCEFSLFTLKFNDCNHSRQHFTYYINIAEDNSYMMTYTHINEVSQNNQTAAVCFSLCNVKHESTGHT